MRLEMARGKVEQAADVAGKSRSRRPRQHRRYRRSNSEMAAGGNRNEDVVKEEEEEEKVCDVSDIKVEVMEEA